MCKNMLCFPNNINGFRNFVIYLGCTCKYGTIIEEAPNLKIGGTSLFDQGKGCGACYKVQHIVSMLPLKNITLHFIFVEFCY